MTDRTVSDTIAAIATGLSNSGIGIVRISGSRAVEIGDQIFKSKNGKKHLNSVPSHTIHFGWIQEGEDIIDEVLVSVMRGPYSYTAEDTVEINCHGGVFVMKRILETAIVHGARPAEPGEFTKRAFLNGRMDLSQAEAVMDMIHAKNEYAVKSSVNQLKGSVSRKIKQLRETLLYEIAFIESALDDPEHISLEDYPEKLWKTMEPVIKDVEHLIATSDNGKLISEGIRTVILGKPNAGKSSLMNVLVGTERAIVTEVAGTTRDTLEEQISLRGITLNLMDTAGIRDAKDTVEQIGVSRAREAAKEADFIIYVVDSSCPLDENDEEILSMIKGKKAVIILNKSDLPTVLSKEDLIKRIDHPVLFISAKEETGIEELEQTVESMFYQGKLEFNDQIMITNVRHKTALCETLSSLNMVKNSIGMGMPEDFLTIDLMAAYEHLGVITGESLEDDLVNEIFSKFCMGK